MTRFLLVSIVGASFMLSACASGSAWHAYPNVAAAPARTTELADAKTPLICRDSPVTGTRLSKRECHTADEWRSIDENGVDSLGVEAARSLPMTDPGSPTGR